MPPSKNAFKTGNGQPAAGAPRCAGRVSTQTEEIVKKHRIGYGLVLHAFAVMMAYGQTPGPIQLPQPQTEGGKPLMEALKARQSIRTFSKERLPLQTVSNMLWAACGINRGDVGKRTAPSARNIQEIQVYVSMEEGLFLYDEKTNMLQPVVAEDIRAATGTQEYVKNAPINLIYVADKSKLPKASEVDQAATFGADTGFISQNVYLFCASEGLATVVRGSVDRTLLAQKMKLRMDQKIILAQTVGYPSQ